MATKINKALNIDGLSVPTGSVISQITHVRVDRELDSEDNLVPRIVFAADLILFASKADYQSMKNSLPTPEEFELAYTKDLTLQEYSDLNGNGSLAEQWTRDYLDAQLGGAHTEYIDLFS